MAREHETRFVQLPGVRLHVVESGPPDGPAVVLLHGFPEFWYGWRRQIEPLAAAGYRVIVPDQRGYNLSDKPRGLGAYRIDELAADVRGLIAATGRGRAFVVGHDWGAAVGWWAAARFPEAVARMVAINAPHPAVIRRQLWTNPRQRRRSWYFFMFQLPWLPEWRMRRRGWEVGRRALQASSRPGTFRDEDLARYVEAWERPGAARGMIHWYRAAFRRPARRPRAPRVRVPSLVIWGARDRFLGRELIAPSLALCDDGRAIEIAEASHWVQHEEPERVNRLLLEFLR